jgi:hypothetical protein
VVRNQLDTKLLRTSLEANDSGDIPRLDEWAEASMAALACNLQKRLR